MNRVLLLLDHKENRRLLAAWLGQKYQVMPADTDQALDEPFDLGILGGPALDRLWERVQARKEAEQPLFLPFLLVTTRKDVRYVTRHLWRTVDELILTPIEKVELQARVEILLRARRLSRQLRAEAIEQLRASEERYRYISEVAFDYLYAFRVEPDGTMRGEWVSDSFVRVFGYTIPEIDARGGWQSMVYPDDLPIALEHARKVVSGQSDICEMRFVTRNGEARWLRDYAKPLFDEASGRVIRIYGASQDITERKRLEEERDRSYRLLMALSQAAQAVLRAHTPGEVYRTIGDEVARLGYHAAIFTLTDDRAHLTPSYLSYEPAVIRAAEKLAGLSAKGYRFPLVPGGLYQQVIAEGKAVFSEPTLEFVAEALPAPLRPLAGRLAALLGLEQSILAPLVVGDETHGLLAVGGTDLSEADMPAVSTFANQAATALENAQLLTSLTEQREQLRTLTARLAEVEEEERRRLARELHDRVGQNLTALSVNIGVARSLLPPETAPQAASRLDDAIALLEQTAESIRDVMGELRPAVLDDYGLLAALHWYGQRFGERTGLAVTVQGEETMPRLPPAVETALFRIAQEALTNVARHAQAGQVTVSLEPVDGGARLTIADDGAGFDPAVPRRPGEPPSWGLLIMRERAEAVGGRLKVESAPGKGTQVVVEVVKGERSAK